MRRGEGELGGLVELATVEGMMRVHVHVGGVVALHELAVGAADALVAVGLVLDQVVDRHHVQRLGHRPEKM